MVLHSRFGTLVRLITALSRWVGGPVTSNRRRHLRSATTVSRNHRCVVNTDLGRSPW